jgi:RHH-type proline utilization regulon transcriptional repressor/proline dehydrogenase/delta 1-pyrroline-5-carboxylate dehydrogenase
LEQSRTAAKSKLDALTTFALKRRLTTGSDAFATTSRKLKSIIDTLEPLTLPALTGEENTVELMPRGQVFCAGETPSSIVAQVIVASAFGNEVVLLKSSVSDELAKILAGGCRVVDSADAGWLLRGEIEGVDPAVVLAEQKQANSGFIREAAAKRRVAVVFADVSGQYDWTQVVRERVTTVNASAAGGNTQLMVLSEDAF